MLSMTSFQNWTKSKNDSFQKSCLNIQARCLQTFLLEPLKLIYPTIFSNPTKGTFNLIGAAEADVIYLNDFRYDSTSEIMQWGDLLNMLDGSAFHTAAPKTSYAKDTVWRKKQPIFATGPLKIQRFHKGSNDLNTHETAQMDARWEYVELHHKIVAADNTLVECARCFAELILGNN